jgi:hypothetical protein
MPHHALDITLIRPLTPAELKTAARASRLALAANADHTRLLTLVPAKNPRRALRKLRNAATGRLPIDALCTLFPDSRNDHLLSIELKHAAYDSVLQAAARCGQRPEEYLRDAVLEALDRAHAAAQAQLDAALDRFLAAGSTPAQLLAAVAKKIA